MGEKKLAEAYILGIPFGLFGAHNFYLKRKFFGILYACTLGLLGIGYIFDLIRMKWLVKHANRYGTQKKMVSDGYIICIVSGLFGGHHYYLGNKKLGLFYTCTLGVFTVGWIVDIFRMKHLVHDHNNEREEKSIGTAYILGLSPLGIFGSYHYYLGNVKLGLIYTFTLGIFGIGWIVDLFRMPKLVRKAGHDRKSVGTAYIMAFPPFGFFGAYHYYLGNYVLGLTYTFTLGIFGIGWVVDLFRMKGLVKAANDPTSDHGMTKITAYVLCVSPLGIFGTHHFYLKRYLNGGFYAATLGLFGFGWVFDMLRLPVLYERYAEEDKHKYADEAYVFWLPFGLFGLHHFYLENKRWGILYACTLGCFTIGWIIDGFRMMSLLKDYNDRIADRDFTQFRICKPNCKACSIYKCRRCCLTLFSNCCKCENFSLSNSPRNEESENTANHNKTVKDDFDVIKEMYPNEQHNGNEDYAMEGASQQNNSAHQVEISTVHESYETYPSKDPHPDALPAYDNGAYPGDPGYDENTYPIEYTAEANVEYPPPYTGDQFQEEGGDYPHENYTYQSEDAYAGDEIRDHEDVGVSVHSEHAQYGDPDQYSDNEVGQGHVAIDYRNEGGLNNQEQTYTTHDVNVHM